MEPSGSTEARALAWLLGFFTVFGQTILARELLVLFHGSELQLGVVFAAWLVCGGLGAILVTRAARERTASSARALATTIAALAAVSLPLAVIAARTAGIWLQIPRGSAPGFGETLWSAGLVTAAVAVPCGGWYVLASAGAGGTSGPGRVYAWEAFGGFAGGALFTFALAGRVDHLTLSLFLGSIVAASVAGLTWHSASRRHRLRAVGLFAVAAALALAGPLLDLGRRSQAARWPGLALLDVRDSRHGNLALVGREHQITLYESGRPSLSFPDPEAAELAAHLPLLAAPSVSRVLVAGGAAGGVLAEVLRHPASGVDYVEFDAAVLDLVAPHLPQELSRALADPRVRVITGDLRAWLGTKGERYDVILLGIPEPTTAAANRFATREFFALTQRALRPGGILALALPSSPNYVGPDLLRRNGSVVRALAEVFPRVELLGEDPLSLLASRSPKPLADPDAMAARLLVRGLETRTLSPELLRSLLDPVRLRFAARNLDALDIPANRDLAPAAYFHHALYRGSSDDPRRGRLLAVAQPARWWVFAVPLALAVIALAFAAPGAPRMRRTIGFAAASTGAAAMSLQYLVLFVYQTTRGALYGGIGLLTGAFMGGLAVGSFISLRGLRHASRRRLVHADAAVLLLPVAATGALWMVTTFDWGWAAPLFADTTATLAAAICGAAAGLEYPWYAADSPARDSPAEAGGRYYALDLVGSAAGMLLTALWLLPLLGIWWTLVFVAELKACSLGLLLLSKNPKNK